MTLPLTPREQEILKLSSEGKTADVIAQILGVKKRTVIFHRANIYSKLGVTTVVQACCKAIRVGYIPVILLAGAVFVLVDSDEQEIPYTPPVNVKPAKNMCTAEDFEDDKLDETCITDGIPVSGVPYCGDSK